MLQGGLGGTGRRGGGGGGGAQQMVTPSVPAGLSQVTSSLPASACLLSTSPTIGTSYRWIFRYAARIVPAASTTTCVL